MWTLTSSHRSRVSSKCPINCNVYNNTCTSTFVEEWYEFCLYINNFFPHITQIPSSFKMSHQGAMKPFPTSTPPSDQFLRCLQEEWDIDQDEDQLMIVDVPPEPSAAVKQQGLQDGRGGQEQGERAAKGGRYPCGTCGKVFRQLTNLIRHRKLHESGPSVNKKAVTCPVCNKVFSRPDNLKRHRKNHSADQLPSTTRQISGQESAGSTIAEAGTDCNPPQAKSPSITKSTCPACGDVFQRVSHMLRHLQNDHRGVSASYPISFEPNPEPSQFVSENKEDPDMMEADPNVLTSTSPTGVPLPSPPQASQGHICPLCDKSFSRHDSLRRHIKTYHESGATPPSIHEEPLSHQISRPESPETVPEDPREFPADDFGEENLQEADDILKALRRHWLPIRTHYTTGRRIQDVYNFRLAGNSTIDVDLALRMIFQRLRCRVKINLSFGFILRHSETGQLRYFHASQNNARLFSTPETVATEQDMDRVRERVRETDILQYGILRRPDTKWTVAATTNVTVYVNKMPQFPIGSPVEKLPHYVANNRGLTNLLRNTNTGKMLDDNFCFFRCLAVHRGTNSHSTEKAVHHLVETYRQAAGKDRVDGITMDELAIAEVVFKVNVQVYTLLPAEIDDDDDDANEVDKMTGEEQCPNKPTIQVELIRRSHRRYPDTLYLNLWGNHFSYISDLSKYSRSYACSKCNTVFTRSWNLMTHEITCDVNVKHKFSGGSYQLPLTIFDKLSEVGIDVEEDMKYYPYRATFDYECYFQSVSPSMRQRDAKLRWEARHELLSCSIASNIPDYEAPRCFVSNGNPRELVSDMVDYLHTISLAAYDTLLEKYEVIFEKMDEMIEDMQSESMPQSKLHKHINKLREQLDEYLQELPVLGFNSGKYDINVIKRYLYPVLQETDPLKLIIKRTSTYMALKTEKLKFLDITNYLAPGYSYAKFLKAYDCPLTKGFFPYEWVDDLDKLEVGSLPPHQAFYSKLKGCNISEEEYQYCQSVWKEHGMNTVRDFLVWYNNLDVVPFLDAVDKMFAFYRQRQMDMFKCAISVPGLSLHYLFLTLPKDTFFSLIDEANKDLYYKLKDNIVGGPSLVFHRYHEKGKTFIRGGTKLCQNIVGFDANALYLWSLMQEMPVGTCIRRRADQDFKPIRSHKFGVMATEWLDWVAHCEDVHIRHQFNSTEKRVCERMIPVDGYCSDTNTVYQFHGCYWHGHPCHLNPNEFNKVRKVSIDDLRRQTEETSAYIRQQGYNLVEMWECEWRQLQATDQTVESFLQTSRLPHCGKANMTQREILEAVMDGSMFGLIECDIQVPEASRDHFAEMPPIFKNIDITRNDIGDHMQSYAEREGIMNTPRRSLIGSMFGTRILLATPLLQWYLNHGLEVLHVHEVIQFKKNKCFEAFGDAVSDARRAGDSDPSKAILADTMKLLGNSAYGKTVTNQERHMNVRVCNDADAPRYVNKSHFRALHALDDDVYEVDMAKKMIRLNLPLQIGFFVYQFAKLRMLEFYYDFLIKFVHPSDFQMCEMDTDSAYLAISGNTLDDVIKEEMKEQYVREKHQWFPRDDTAPHRAYDKRTPGLFKVEWEGDGIIALCSKTYYCFGSKNKISCKGLNKANNDITKQQYMEVITSQTASGGVNRGFRMQHDGMYTYEQVKTAFSYLYPKRKVASDGVSTSYLDL
ncbi:uncharacterized protein LOC119737233 [Patiria miniata]|uniref:DNA-directed DNA polymerase n=1 Tax=Patiria miniata TaxID=46514 RepID=A0A914AUC0_PATMI|nr:uncharacterized protein LOC119737233 [Patiria miniata]